MNFPPQMQTRTDGFTVEGGLKWRAWNGVIADVWDVHCAAGAGGEYVSEYPRLFVVLNAEAPMTIADAPPSGIAPSAPGNISYIPAGMRTWSRASSPTPLRHLDLHLDLSVLAANLAERLDGDGLAAPRLMFGDDRLMVLARLLAEQVVTDTPLNDLYGDSLCQALFVDLFRIAPPQQRRRGQLSAFQLRRVTDFIETHCMRSIRLQELAELAGLSQSYFSHAFKASTGIAPHQWQMRFRIRKVQEMLAIPTISLTAIADSAGFADQAHLTRVFKQHVGITPAAWQRARGFRSGGETA
jgi:AraC family transcriptional regulator